MSLIQWEAMKDIEDLFDRTTQSLTWPLARRALWPAMLASQPRVDIFERDGSYVIEADVPGIARDDLRVSLDDGVLTIQGERRQEKREDHPRFHRLERAYGSFTRSFTLPGDCDTTGLQAACHEGQLSITVPRKAAPATPSAIQVPVQ
ncbi:MAG: Hsp20/alpha crystallin family protein [Synechococcus sp.]|nr:Hsp20/alpha crystallin family protein [Synechococcus sp.]